MWEEKVGFSSEVIGIGMSLKDRWRWANWNYRLTTYYIKSRDIIREWLKNRRKKLKNKVMIFVLFIYLKEPLRNFLYMYL